MAKLNNTLITGSLRITDDLSLNGAASISSTLNVAGASTLAGLTAGASTLSSLTVSGNSTLAGLTAGASTLSSLTVNGATNLKSTVTVGGALTVTGNLTVNGTTTTVSSTNLTIKDNLIILAKDNTAALTKPAGILVPKYDGTNYGALGFDSEGVAYVGDVAVSGDNIDTASTSTTWLPIVVRSGLSSSNDGQLTKWDNTHKSIMAAGYSKGINTNNTKTLATISNAADLVDSKSTYHQFNKISTYGIPLLKYSSVSTSGTTYTYTVVNADGTAIALENYDNFILDINKSVSSTATVKITYASKTYTLVESAVSTGSSFTNLDLTYPVLCKVISSTQIAIVGQISGKTGSTNTDSKIYLVGATSQANNTNTYSDSEVYTTNGTLTTKEVEVGGGSVNMRYDSTAKALRFVFE